MFIKYKKYFWFLRTILLKLFFGKIGNYSYIAPRFSLINPSRIFIGNRVRIGYDFRAEVYGNGKIILQDNISIGNSLHLSAFEDLFINSNVTISSRVFIGSLDHSYENINIHIMDQELRGKKIVIEENCFIGSGAVILS